MRPIKSWRSEMGRVAGFFMPSEKKGKRQREGKSLAKNPFLFSLADWRKKEYANKKRGV